MASGASPPKPWERAGAGSTSSAAVPSSTTTSTADTTASAPALPSRPDSLNTMATRNAGAYSSPYNRTSSYSSPYGYGSTFGGSSFGSPYSSPYNRFGGGYGGMGAMGGMGGMYGGGMYASPYGGMGGYGGPGMMGGPQDQSLTQTMNNSTQATFQMIESIVGAFGGFAQMLESTYMATHSSFFAMVSVAEQSPTTRLKQRTHTRQLRRIQRSLLLLCRPDGAPPRPSRKPFIFFLVAVFGLPYLMGKLIRALAATQEAESQRLAENNPQQPLDPSKLDFCRVLYDYTPPLQPGQPTPTEGIDLAVSKGDLVAVLSKSDPLGNASEWWRCRARDGRVGYLPSPYLETIQRRPQQGQIAAKSHPSSPEGSRLNTMSTVSGGSGNGNGGTGTRTNSMAVTGREKEKVQAQQQKVGGGGLPPKMAEGKPGDISVESFQRAAWNS
ncbi:hypothetical protein BTJ68_13561 [Hortaea werneckii EXF-2000]|uniref:Peroxisomal membrane protein PEX13 n=1 Tax=Hortaea werneckii EXF-2000 TaxID=1157616 RepID=A0A1Z5SPY7_HORWE|nr:hypothetical protein BTJ68_13561 [Hortaea werneckii EXF-2000]